MAAAEIKQRIYSYDVFRGVLILAMVIVHVWVNFFAHSLNPGLYYWIPVGFMLFLGVILGQFLKNKPKKVIGFAVKLLAVFFLFNIPVFFNNAQILSWKDFLMGNQAFFSLEILFPMGVFALFCVLFQWFWEKVGVKSKKLNSWLLLIFLLSLIFISDFVDYYSYNFVFFLYAGCGYLIGTTWNLNEIALQLTSSRWFYVNIVLLVVSFFMILWFPLLRIEAVLQTVGIYLLFSSLRSNVLIFLGKHSFVIYVGHIVVIKIVQMLIS